MITITIEPNKLCAECGKKGATDLWGICLKCAARALAGKPMRSGEANRYAEQIRKSLKESDLGRDGCIG